MSRDARPQAAADAARRHALGWRLHRDGRAAEALAQYDAALAADPRHAPSLHHSALVLLALGRLEAATDRIERSLAIDGRSADAWSNAGLIHEAAGRLDAAANAFERATTIEPGLAQAWTNLASLKLDRGDAIGAEAAAARALAIAPSAAASYNRALAWVALARPGDALAALAAVAAASRTPAMAGLAAECATALGRIDEARAHLDAALAAADDPRLLLQRARLADRQDDVATMVGDYRAIVGRAAIDQMLYESALGELIFASKRRASWNDLAALRRTFRAGVAHHARRGDASWLAPFGFLSDDSTREEQRAAAEAWSRRFPATPPDDSAVSTGRLRIGYLSGGLHDHATAILMVGLFERHDRTAFEVFGYSSGPDDGSALRRRVAAAFDRFVDVRGWSDAAIADAIRRDRIDLLVDVDGHTADARTGVTAARPAPIVVAYLGYPGTSGASFVDYLIGDPIVTPLADADDYTETLALLPASYQVTDDRREIGERPSRASLGLPDDAVVLCAFHAPYKIGEPAIDAWAAILRRVPPALLWLQARGPASTRANLVAAFAARGIGEERLRFAPELPHRDYLALYRAADLFVDTWPYNAHTTGSDALWAGCPLVTLRGETFASRVGESLLRAVGRAQWVAADVAGYVELVVALANDRAGLRDLRVALEADVGTSALFDTAATTRAIEAAYREMAAQRRAGRRSPIAVAP